MKRILNQWLNREDGEMVKAEVFVRDHESEEVENTLEQLGICNYMVVIFYQYEQ